VHQFVWGEMDGPMPFHYPGAPYAADLDLEERPHA
jgi:phospholipid/cholesterol/gamma-HCH transport system ATP-binding protein